MVHQHNRTANRIMGERRIGLVHGSQRILRSHQLVECEPPGQVQLEQAGKIGLRIRRAVEAADQPLLTLHELVDRYLGGLADARQPDRDGGAART